MTKVAKPKKVSESIILFAVKMTREDTTTKFHNKVIRGLTAALQDMTFLIRENEASEGREVSFKVVRARLPLAS